MHWWVECQPSASKSWIMPAVDNRGVKLIFLIIWSFPFSLKFIMTQMREYAMHLLRDRDPPCPLFRKPLHVLPRYRVVSLCICYRSMKERQSTSCKYSWWSTIERVLPFEWILINDVRPFLGRFSILGKYLPTMRHVTPSPSLGPGV